MKKIFIIEEYKATKNKGEDFLHWLLVRKLNIFGKIFIALLLGFLWLKYAFNLVFMVNFLKYQNVNQNIVISTIQLCFVVLIVMINRLIDLKHQHLYGTFFLSLIPNFLLRNS